MKPILVPPLNWIGIGKSKVVLEDSSLLLPWVRSSSAIAGVRNLVLYYENLDDDATQKKSLLTVQFSSQSSELS